MERAKIIELVNQMTLEEKISLTSGKDGWFLKDVERLGIPSIRTSDGPHGLRKITEADMNALGGASAPAVCFPAACATGSSFDRELMEKLGEVLGRESQAYGVDVLLGPGVNMKRTPLCGRNFEYISEDPVLAGELAASYVKGVQSQGVGTSLKHFLANSQETRRMDLNAVIDERALREIYMPAFETVVKKSQPWTVMASYNKVNGSHSTANKWALTDVLRGEWGFEGMVVSDWGATHDRPAVIAAGTDLTMPAVDPNGGTHDGALLEGLRNGTVTEEELNACCARILELVFKCVENRQRDTEFNAERDHDFAREVEENSMVLLKNNGILPLSQKENICFIGRFAKEPRIQGGGSSYINCIKIVSACTAACGSVPYAEGYLADGSTTDELIREAAELASGSDAAVLFIGLPEDMETEGVDRLHMRLPEGHNRLVEAVCAVNPNAVIVLHNGSPVEMPWAEKPAAILEAYLGGQAVGEATVNVLYGKVNPSGRLAETFPVALEDNPTYLTFPGEGARAKYTESIFVGYRYYTSKKQRVLFPFGHGLSYTTFAFSDLTLSTDDLTENDTVEVRVKVKNTGDRAGKSVVQLYVAPEKVEIIRPVRELKDFTKVSLAPGEEKEVAFTLDSRAFAHWNEDAHGWRCETGKYAVQICENAEKVLLSIDLNMTGAPIPPIGGYNTETPMKLIARIDSGRRFLDENIVYLVKGMVHLGYIPEAILQVIDSLPGGLTLDAISMISKRGGGQGGAGGARGLDALLAQPVSNLNSFLPTEKKQALAALIAELNK